MGEQQKVNQADTDLNHVLKARRDKLAELQTAGKDPFQITKYDVTAHSMDIKDNYEQWEGKEAAIAGRMMFKRVMGKASFCNVQDLKGSIQVYVARDSVGEESYKDFKKMDIGDIVGVKGTAFTTKTGEISIHATEVTLLSKSLQLSCSSGSTNEPSKDKRISTISGHHRCSSCRRQPMAVQNPVGLSGTAQ